MSDVSKGPGWWLANDGKWYPPTTLPSPPSLSTTGNAQQSPADAETTTDPSPPSEQPVDPPGTYDEGGVAYQITHRLKPVVQYQLEKAGIPQLWRDNEVEVPRELERRADEIIRPITSHRPVRWMSQAAEQTVSKNALYGSQRGAISLTREGLEWTASRGSGYVRFPWDALHFVSIDNASRSRLTVTRAVAVGVFALGARKSVIATALLVQDGRGIQYQFLLPGQGNLYVSNRIADGLAQLYESHEISSEQYASARQRILHLYP